MGVTTYTNEHFVVASIFSDGCTYVWTQGEQQRFDSHLFFCLVLSLVVFRHEITYRNFDRRAVPYSASLKIVVEEG